MAPSTSPVSATTRQAQARSPVIRFEPTTQIAFDVRRVIHTGDESLSKYGRDFCEPCWLPNVGRSLLSAGVSASPATAMYIVRAWPDSPFVPAALCPSVCPSGFTTLTQLSKFRRASFVNFLRSLARNCQLKPADHVCYATVNRGLVISGDEYRFELSNSKCERADMVEYLSQNLRTIYDDENVNSLNIEKHDSVP